MFLSKYPKIIFKQCAKYFGFKSKKILEFNSKLYYNNSIEREKRYER